jgi:hypothetical protein
LSCSTSPEPLRESRTTFKLAGSVPAASGQDALPLPVTTPPCGSSICQGASRHDAIAGAQRTRCLATCTLLICASSAL